MAVAELMSHFETVARSLRWERNDEGATLDFLGVLRNPTPQEMLGGLRQDARIVVARASDFIDASVAPTTKDRIIDLGEGNREYAIEEEHGWVWAGGERAWWRGVVLG